jgi:hypothetical protein
MVSNDCELIRRVAGIKIAGKQEMTPCRISIARCSPYTSSCRHIGNDRMVSEFVMKYSSDPHRYGQPYTIVDTLTYAATLIICGIAHQGRRPHRMDRHSILKGPHKIFHSVSHNILHPAIPQGDSTSPLAPGPGYHDCCGTCTGYTGYGQQGTVRMTLVRGLKK